MGKQAKKKEKTETQASNQKRHNRNTKGINTKNQGSLWSIRLRKTKEDGKEVIKTYEVRVPPHTLFNPDDRMRTADNAPEPFDSFQLDWREELVHYAADNEAKLGSITLDNGSYLHRVYVGDNVENPDKILIELQSSKKLILEKKGPRRRSRRKKA